MDLRLPDSLDPLRAPPPERELQELREHNRMLESMLDLTPCVLYIYDLVEKRNVFSNDGIRRILGYSAREIREMGSQILPLLMHPTDEVHYLRDVFPRYAQAGDGERIVTQYRMKTRAGAWKWIESTEVVYKRDPEGAPLQILGVAMDIDERRRAEEALEDSHEILAEFVRHSPTYSFIKDVSSTESRVLIASENYLDMIGIAGHEMAGKTMQQLFPAELAASMTADDWKVATSGEVLRLDEELGGRSFSSIKFPIRRGDRLLMAGYTIDVTERKRIEHELRETRAILQTAMDQSPAGIAIADAPSGKLRYVNDAGLLIRGGDRKAIVEGVGVEQYVASWQLFDLDGTALPRDQVPLARAVLYGESSSRELIVRREDHDERIVIASAAPILGEGGAVEAGITVFMDITERRRSEVELERHRGHLEELVEDRTSQLAEANRDLESFCHSVSHDLRAPLRHLDGFVQLLLSECNGCRFDDGRRYAQTIAKAAASMGTLIDDLLRLSRTNRQEMRFQEVDMNQVLREALIPIREGCSARIVEWSVGDLPPVRGDHNLLRLAWSNLLDNAVKYTRNAPVARIEVACQEVGSEHVFSIRDNGVGFDMRYAGNLFGVFQRLHRQDEFEGTGIGLATVQRIVARHKGRIWAEAEEGKGAVFRFALPVGDPTGA